jgi:hypothetical protein
MAKSGIPEKSGTGNPGKPSLVVSDGQILVAEAARQAKQHGAPFLIHGQSKKSQR